MDHTTRSISLRLTKCQNFRPKNTYTCYHALPEASECCASLSTCFHVPPWVLMRWHMCTCHALTRAHAPCADMHVLKLWRHPSLYGLTCLFNLDRLENLTQSELPAPNKKIKKIKKKRKKEKVLTKLNFDFDQEVKIVKRGLSHLVFHIHSDFGIRFFVRQSKFEQIVQFPKSWLLHKYWLKVNFQEGPVLPNFSHRFRF